MAEPPPPLDADEATLAELAESDMAVVRHVKALILATTDPDEVNGLGRTYQRVSRCVRQTLALKAKLKREQALSRPSALRAHETSDLELDGLQFDLRIEAIQDAVSRVISAATDHEPERREELYDRFDSEMDDWEMDADFLTEDLDAQVRAACRTLDLPDDLAATWRKLPAPVWTPDPATDPATDDEAEDEPTPAAAPPAFSTGSG